MLITRRSPPGRLLFLLALLLVFGCGRHEPVKAVGANDEISVLMNAAREGGVGDELRRLFTYPVKVPGPEAAYRLDFVPFSRFHTHQYVKNQVFAVDLSGDDRLAQAIPGMLGANGAEKIEAREPFLLLLRDVWATGQTSLFAVAWSRDELRELLARADSTQLRRDYERAVTSGLVKTMYSLGENRSIAAQVARQYGWTLRVPSGFFAAEDAKGRVVKFNAQDPVRLLVVHWLPEPLPLTEESWKPVISRLLDVYNDGDFVLEERTQTYAMSFQGEPALRWEGVWQNEKYVIGGPFRAVAFHRGADSFLLVGIVFAPGQDKVFALRQMDAIFNTFRRVD